MANFIRWCLVGVVNRYLLLIRLHFVIPIALSSTAFRSWHSPGERFPISNNGEVKPRNEPKLPGSQPLRASGWKYLLIVIDPSDIDLFINCGTLPRIRRGHRHSEGTKPVCQWSKQNPIDQSIFPCGIFGSRDEIDILLRSGLSVGQMELQIELLILLGATAPPIDTEAQRSWNDAVREISVA